MGKATHLIQKQVLDFEFESKTAAMKWQRTVPFSYQDELRKKIVIALDAHDDGRFHSLEKVELNLGFSTLEEIPKKLENALKLNLGKKLHHKVVGTSRTMASQGANTPSERENGTKTKAFGEFVHFLQNGFLPWSSTDSTIADLEIELEQCYGMETLSAILRSKSVLDNRWARNRLYYQFSKNFTRRLTKSYFKTEAEKLLMVVNTLEDMVETFAMGKAILKNRFGNQEKRIQGIVDWILIKSSNQKIKWIAEFTQWYGTSILQLHKNKFQTELYAALTTLAIDKVGTSEINTILEREILTFFAHGVTDLDGIAKDDTGTAKERNAQKPKTKTAASEEDKTLATSKETRETNGLGLKSLETDYKDSKKISKEAHTSKVHESEIKNAEENEAFQESGKTSMVNKLNDEGGQGVNGTDGKDVGENQLDKTEKRKIRQETEEELEDDSMRLPSLNTGEKRNIPDGSTNESGDDFSLEEDFSSHETNSELIECYVRHSGLILTWPYLARLFKNLEYRNGDKFESKEQQQRAVCLLGYIATGENRNEEQHLIMPKLLGGWHLKMPIAKDVELQEEEMEQADAMLRALIQNWTILKKTSIAGLRETFFIREGKLKDEEENWRLIVEQRGTDILLDHLPYGRSIIALPWLKKMIKVDWA